MGLTEVMMNIGMSIAATGIWAFLGLFLYRKEKNTKRRLAFFMLHANLDRLRDHLDWTLSALEDGLPVSEDLELFEEQEIKLLRLIQAFNYEWTIANLPYETKKVKWMLDLDYILGNCREMANEMYTLRSEIRQNGDRVGTTRDSLVEVARDVREAIVGEIELIPDQYKRSME